MISQPATDPSRHDGTQPHLSLWDTASIIVGIVIGAGIYETAPLIFSNVSGPWMALAVWAIGGVLSLIGALCYAELATTYPRSGGDYTYLSRAYGSWAGFLFGWAQLAVLMTGSIGMMAYIFADYAVQVWNFGPLATFVYASLAVLVLSAINIAGLVFGKTAQNILTCAKVVGLSSIFLVGLLWAGSDKGEVRGLSSAATSGSLGLAMVFVLYTYGGWNDAALVSAEVENRRRNIPRALILGTAIIAIIYLLINAAYLMVLGFDGARQSNAIAADVLARPFGTSGAKIISLLVMVSALGAVNGMIYTGSRIYSTVGEDFGLFRWLARWHPALRTPIRSLLIQMLITLLLIALVGTNQGRSLLNAMVQGLGLGTLSWRGHGGFETLLQCTSPVFWLLFLMSAVAVIVLRYKDRHVERPFTVPLFPVLPLIFCATCAYMLYRSADYAGKLIIVGIIPLAIGVLLYILAARSTLSVPAQNRNDPVAGKSTV